MERTEQHVRMFGVVHAYDEAADAYLVYPNRLAFGVQCAPLAGNDETTAAKLNLMLALNWPAGTLMQVCLYASPDLLRITTDYASMRRDVRDPALKQLTRSHLEFMEEGTRHPVDAASGLRLHDSQLTITVQVPFKGDAPSEEDFRRLRELRTGFEQALKSAGMPSRPLTPKRYLRLMSTILNQADDASWRQSPLTGYDPAQVLASQVLDPGSAVEVDDNGLWLNGNTRVRVLSPKEYPDIVYFGLALRYLADWKQGARGIRENCLITLNMYFPDQESTRAKKEKDLLWTTHQASTPIAKYVKFFRERKASLEAVLNPVKDGDRIVQSYLSMAVFSQGEGDSPEQRARTEAESVAAAVNASSYWREFGFQMMQDRYIVAPLFSQLLPFAGDEGLRKVLERYKTMSGRHAVALMPVLGSWRGTGTPLMTLVSRDGQVQPLSMWDTDTNMNFIIAAQSGSGKSVMSQSLLANMRSVGGRCFVIDNGDSYKNLCEGLGGSYLTFGSDDQVSLNLFSMIRDFDEEAGMLVGVLKIMIAPNTALTDFELSELQRILGLLFRQHRNDLTIDHVAQMLQEEHNAPEVVRMGQQLYAWTGQGPYGRYFQGKASIDISNPFTVLELGGLRDKPQLQRVVLMTLMFMIGQAVYQGDRGEKKLLLIDEAWELLAKDDAALFIEKAYRQFRKMGASVGVVTQSVMDVWENPGGRAIAENSAHMYLLRQKADSIDAVRRDSLMPFGDWGYDMLKTVHTAPGNYAEIMCVTPMGVGIGRLILNNVQKVMFSTKAEDVVALRKLRDSGMSLAEAVNALVIEQYGQRRLDRAA